MKENFLSDKKAARVLDLLEQIKRLNSMINLHQNQSKDNLMISQYLDMKNRFLQELKNILSDFEIEVLIKNEKAA